MPLDEETILKYASGTATEDQILLVDTAMAADPVLFGRVRSLLYLKERFDELWSSFSLEDFAQTARRARLAAATAAAARHNPALAERLRGWIREATLTHTESFRLLVDQAKRVAGVAAETLSQRLIPRLQLSFGGIGSPDRALEQHLRQGMISLADDDVESATRELEAAARLDPREAQNAWMTVEEAGQTFLEIRANAIRCTLEVKCSPGPGHPVPHAVLLVPDHDPESAVAAPFEPVEGEDSWLAEFISVPSGTARIIVVK